MRKLFTLLLTIVMLLTLASPVFAEEAPVAGSGVIGETAPALAEGEIIGETAPVLAEEEDATIGETAPVLLEEEDGASVGETVAAVIIVIALIAGVGAVVVLEKKTNL